MDYSEYREVDGEVSMFVYKSGVNVGAIVPKREKSEFRREHIVISLNLKK